MVLTNKTESGPAILNTGLTVNYSGAPQVTTNSISINPVSTDNGDALVLGNLQVTGNIYANSKLNSYSTVSVPNVYAKVGGTTRTCTQGSSPQASVLHASKIWNGSNYTVNVDAFVYVTGYGASSTIADLWVEGIPGPPLYTLQTAGCFLSQIGSGNSTLIPLVVEAIPSGSIGSGITPSGNMLHVNFYSQTISVTSSSSVDYYYINFTYYI